MFMPVNQAVFTTKGLAAWEQVEHVRLLVGEEAGRPTLLCSG